MTAIAVLAAGAWSSWILVVMLVVEERNRTRQQALTSEYLELVNRYTTDVQRLRDQRRRLEMEAQRRLTRGDVSQSVGDGDVR